MSWISSSLFGGATSSPALAVIAQERLLQHFLKRSAFEVRTSNNLELNYVVIHNKNKARTTEQHKINHPSYVPSANVNKKKTLVLMHGFGLGLGFFYENFDSLADHYDRIIAVDWLGMGCSSRTSRRITKLSMIGSLCNDPNKKTREQTIAREVADEFIDSLEEVLRVEEEADEFVLAGHSLGGSLAAKYALKYPKSVSGLILISPVGIPLPPIDEERMEDAKLDWRIRLMKNLWTWNFTPQSIVRIAGSKGPGLVENVLGRRFGHRWHGEDLKLITDYFYQITAAPGNGEYCLNALLEPVFLKPTSTKVLQESPNHSSPPESVEEENGANPPPSMRRSGVFAKNPVEDELASLKVPLLLIYGDNDWLYYPTASQSINKWRGNGVNAQLAIVPNSGHHLYLDNADHFNQLVTQWSTKNVK